GGGATGFLWTTGTGLQSGVVTIPATGIGTITFYDVMGASYQCEGLTQVRPVLDPILFTSTTAPSTLVGTNGELTLLSVNTGISNAIPVALMKYAPTGNNITASQAYKILLSGRDPDASVTIPNTNGQTLASYRLKLDGSQIYTSTTPGLYT